MKIVGYIPEKLVYICRPKQKISVKWEEIKENDKPILELDCQPAFISDAKNSQTIKTGMEWAKYSHSYDYEKKNTPEVFEFDNDPIGNIRIVDYDTRYKGAVVFKCIVNNKFYCDFRVDVLTEALLNSDIFKGIINDYFIWARVGSQMKLVRIGSELHKAAIDATNFDKQKKLKNLDIGGIYESKSGNKFVFLGEYYDFVTYEQNRAMRMARKNEFLEKKYPRAFAFKPYYDYDKKKYSFGSLFFVKDHGYKEKVGDILIDPYWYREDIKEAEKYISMRSKTDSYYYNNISYYSVIFNFCKTENSYLTDFKKNVIIKKK